MAPTVAAAACVDGAATTPTITLPRTAGLVYVVDPAGPFPTTGTEAVVTANLVEGFAWDGSAPVGFRGPAVARPAVAQVALPAGWTLVSPTEATFPVTLPPAPDCAVAQTGELPTGPETTPAGETPTAPAEPAPPDELAFTGPGRTAAQLAVAAAALLAGSLLVRTGSRRRLR